MPQFRDQFDAAQTPLAAAFSLKLGHVYNAFIASLTGTHAIGDTLYASSTTAFSRLAGNTTATKKFLSQTGDGSASAAPVWETIQAADVSDFNEAVDDRAAALIQNGTGLTWSYNDAAGTLTPTVTVTQYTDEMAQDAAASLIQNGTGISWSYNDAAGTLTPTVTLAPFSTSNLSEGSNLYFTDDRVDDRVAALLQNGGGITWSYNDGSGTLTPTVTLSATSGDLAASRVGCTATNDDAAAGDLGEYKASFLSGTTARDSTVTITIASPAVITWTAHPLFPSTTACVAVAFSTTGALPTGITAGTVYYATYVSANTFKISTSVANAMAGTYVNTSGSQSGVHTCNKRISQTTSTTRDMAGVSLTAGDWEVEGTVYYIGDGATDVDQVYLALATASGTGSTFEEGRYGSDQFPATYVPQANIFKTVTTPLARFSLAATTTIFLCFTPQFTVSTMIAYGSMRARRVR